MVVLDTSVLIHYLHGNQKVIDVVDGYLAKEKASITCINEYELLKGTANPDEVILNNFISALNVYWLSERSLIFASRIYRDLKGKGVTIDDADILIAAMAFANGETVLTTDKDFEEIGSKQIKIIKSN
ncbi:MAG: PIN domain-containing protein [Candidatus Micrarchaeales archaeon]